MTRRTSYPPQHSSSAGFFARLLSTVFTMELTVMLIFSGMLERLTMVSASLADAALVVLFSAPLVWYTVVRPVAGGTVVDGRALRAARAALFIRVQIVIFLIEFMVNLTVPLLLLRPEGVSRYFADACLTTLLCAPLLWWLLSREQRSQIDSLADLLGTPLKLYLMLLSAVFMVDLLEMPFVPLFSPAGSQLSRKLADAFLTTLIVAPVFWWLVIRPLRKTAWSEKSRSNAVQAQVVEAIVTIDEQGAIENFNPAAERIFGYTAAEITGRPVTVLFGETEQTLGDLLRSAASIENGNSTQLIHEVLGRRRDGSTLFMAVSISRTLLEGRLQFLVIMRDISKRKQAEQTLRKSLVLLTATLESSADGIVAIDDERRIQTFNQKFLDMWQIPREVAETSDDSALLAYIRDKLEDPEAFMARVEQLYSQPWTTALEIVRFKDGRVFERYSQPQLLEGKIAGRVWSFRDITGRTRAEAALRESEERFNIALSGTSDGIWDWNVQRGAVYYTPRLEEILGYATEHFPDGIATFESLLHPEDHDRMVAAVRSHLRERTPYDVECRLRTKAGSYRWFRVRGQAVWDEAGKPVRMAGSISDITKRKMAEEALRESEERFRQLFEQSEDAIFFFKPGTCYIIDVNATTEKLFGYSKAELKAGGLERLSRPDDFARLSGIICGIRRGEMSYLDKIVNLRKDGSEIIVSMRGKAITIQGVDLIYCTFRNVTERVRMEEEARNIQAKLIQANKMTSLGLLVSGVAHEINNPNNFIMANSQLLSRSWDDALKILREYYRENGDFLIGGIPFSEMAEHSPQLFAGIIDGARRINEIVNNLKSFARRDQTATERAVDVNQVITAAVSILHHQLVKHTENFHLDLAETIPRVRGNGQQLEQVFINLLMNACQALPAKQCGIWVTTGFDAVAGLVTISVRDEGGGMSREVGNRIMEPFFTTKLDSGGTGLGLSISHSIIKEHNGSLEFESEPGKGTTFTVKIPAGEPGGEESSA